MPSHGTQPVGFGMQPVGFGMQLVGFGDREADASRSTRATLLSDINAETGVPSITGREFPLSRHETAEFVFGWVRIGRFSSLRGMDSFAGLFA